MPTHKAYTFASRTRLDSNQNLQKSMLFPTHLKRLYFEKNTNTLNYLFYKIKKDNL